MKHRTVTVFIVVLAALTAVPQAFEQLSSLKDAAGNRLTAGVWSAFLSLNGQKVAGGARARELSQTERLLCVATPQESLPQSAQGSRRDTSRPSKSVERAQPEPSSDLANVEEALGMVTRELAMLDGLNELISVEAEAEPRVIIHAPRPPAAVHTFAPASLPAPRAEAVPAVFKLDKMMKGVSLKHLQERFRVENVRRAAAAERAVEAEATRGSEYAWSFEQSRPSSRTPSCDAETDQQLTN